MVIALVDGRHNAVAGSAVSLRLWLSMCKWSLPPSRKGFVAGRCNSTPAPPQSTRRVMSSRAVDSRQIGSSHEDKCPVAAKAADNAGPVFSLWLPCLSFKSQYVFNVPSQHVRATSSGEDNTPTLGTRQHRRPRTPERTRLDQCTCYRVP